MKYFYSCWLVCCFVSVEAQQDVESSINITTPKEKITLIANLDRRFSWIKNYDSDAYTKAAIWGGRVGIYSSGGFKTGVGYYFLNQKIEGLQVSFKVAGTDNICKDCFSKRNMNFGVVFFEPIWIRKQYWDLSTPLEIGYGYNYTHIYQHASGTNPTEIANEKGNFIPTGTALSLTLKMPVNYTGKPLRWFGLNGVVGYRKIITDNLVKEDLSGMYYSARVVFFLGRFVKDYKIWRHNRKPLPETSLIR